ncbi:MAG: hypothetical protein FWD82_04420 [Defluviitaleaceae bacterium]|nr:hypothetical protein [Defluviitaleaceae bacterium]
MEFVFFGVATIGLALLAISIIMLVAPFVGWNHRYDASVTETMVNIPKPGRYGVNIRRDRFWLWRGHGTLANMFPKVNFSVEQVSTYREVKYTPSSGLMQSHGTRNSTILVGYFEAVASGYYRIISLPESEFLENEEIVIRKHMSFAKLFLLIWGIVIGSLIFAAGLTFAILVLTGAL